MAKSFVSALVGVAIDKKQILGGHQSIRDFLPELDSSMSTIKIVHLLKHTSGIGFTKSILDPSSDNAQYYYSKDLRTLVRNLKVEFRPGRTFNYSSVNYQLLGIIIKRASGQLFSANLEQNLWKPMGLENESFGVSITPETLPLKKPFVV